MRQHPLVSCIQWWKRWAAGPGWEYAQEPVLEQVLVWWELVGLELEPVRGLELERALEDWYQR